MYDAHGMERIQDTYPRKNYIKEEDRYKRIADRKLKEENDRLHAEIEYLKKSQSLAEKTRRPNNKRKG